MFFPPSMSKTKERLVVLQGPTKYDKKKIKVRAVSPFAPTNVNIVSKFPRIHHLVPEIGQTKEEFNVVVQSELQRYQKFELSLQQEKINTCKTTLNTSPMKTPQNKINSKQSSSMHSNNSILTTNHTYFNENDLSYFDLRSESPGPSHYRPDSSAIFPNTCKYRIGTEPRDLLSSPSPKSSAPGPSEYRVVDVNLVKKKTTFAFRFPCEKRMTLKKSQTNEDLGPGIYEVARPVDSRGEIYHKIGFPKAERTTTIGREMIPGVGKYNIENIDLRQARTPSYSIGCADRFQNFDNGSPGVGDYNVGNFKTACTPNATITKDSRFQWHGRQQSPPLTKYHIERGFDSYIKAKVEERTKTAFQRSNSPRLNQENQYLRRFQLKKKKSPLVYTEENDF